MKRLWPLPVLLLLALPLRAQEGDDAAPQEEQPAAAEGEGVENGDASPPEDVPVAEPNSSEEQPPQDGAVDGGEEGGDAVEKPAQEEPLISVEVAAPESAEGDEASIAPAVPKKKVVPTATLMKAPMKVASSAARGVKAAKGKKAKKPAPPVVKAKAPALAAEPPPPPLPAVPLTPIAPRNP